MSNSLWLRISILHVLVVATGFSQTVSAQAPVDQVNVMVGTAAEGQTFPSTGVPFAMTGWTPQTRAGEVKCVAPYYAADTKIQGFRGSHFLSGSCAQDYGSFTFMPLASPEALDAEGRASTFSHSSEHASPYRYAVDLGDSGIHAEITGSERSGMMQFRFRPGVKTGWLDVEDNIRLGTGHIHIDATRQEITGDNPVYRIYAGSGQPAGFSGYIVVQFDRPIKVGGTWTGKDRQPDSVDQAATASPLGAYVSFELPPSGVVHVRIGTSFTSVEEARRNLSAEIPDWNFNTAADRARTEWNKQLSVIQIAGSSPTKRVFYTALYHSKLLPRIVSDRDGTYPRFASGMFPDGPRTETAQGFTYYDDYSVWDTFRAIHPLFTIIDPTRDLDMIKSLIAKGEQGGFLPIFPAWSSYTTEMTGDHVSAIITDAYVKGIRGFDAEAAYRLMKKNATELPATTELYREGQGRRALDSYMKYGYIPLEDPVPNAFHGNEQVSRTLDYAFDDFEVSVLSRALGHTADADAFAVRAQNYRKVIDPEVGFARGRHADGSWITPFDPTAKATYITESVPYVYTFFAPQDVPGLIQWLQGPEQFIAKLDSLFKGGYYDQGNEPSHQIAYLYDDAGVPAKTQLHVHQIMSTLYKDGIDGLPGNDDAGQMSAWYVLSAMGFYQVTPGIPRYAIGTPTFDHLTLHLPSGRSLKIEAPGAEGGKFYVRSVRLNGVRLNRTWITHSEILAGGALDFEMSDLPSAP
jgi:predicted alpha-1,2-mannosidase